MGFFSKLYIWLRGETGDEMTALSNEFEIPCNCAVTPPPTAITRDSMLKPKRKYTKRTPKKAIKKKVGRPKKKK